MTLPEGGEDTGEVYRQWGGQTHSHGYECTTAAPVLRDPVQSTPEERRGEERGEEEQRSLFFFFCLTRYDSSHKLCKIQVLYGKQGRTPGSTGAKEYIVRHTSDLER